jgi:hypothetical protein
MAKRKKGSKVQKRGKLRRGNAAKRGKPSKAAKRTVARAKAKRAPVKKVARKVKQPVTPVVEAVAFEVIEQPAPGAGDVRRPPLLSAACVIAPCCYSALPAPFGDPSWSRSTFADIEKCEEGLRSIADDVIE